MSERGEPIYSASPDQGSSGEKKSEEQKKKKTTPYDDVDQSFKDQTSKKRMFE